MACSTLSTIGPGIVTMNRELQSVVDVSPSNDVGLPARAHDLAARFAAALPVHRGTPLM